MRLDRFELVRRPSSWMESAVEAIRGIKEPGGRRPGQTNFSDAHRSLIDAGPQMTAERVIRPRLGPVGDKRHADALVAQARCGRLKGKMVKLTAGR
jgi:hypothetical protein